MDSICCSLVLKMLPLPCFRWTNQTTILHWCFWVSSSLSQFSQQTYIHIFTAFCRLVTFQQWKWNRGMNTWHQYICSKSWIIFHLDRWSAARVNQRFHLDRAAAHTCGGSDWILRRWADQRARQHNSICVQLCPCALGSCWFSWLTKD